MFAQPRHRAARHALRHDARVLRARTAPHAPRHGLAGEALPRLRHRSRTRTSPARARSRSRSARCRSTRAAEYAAEDADVTLRLHQRAVAAARSASRRCSASTTRSRCRWCRCCARMERHGVLIDAADAARAEPASSAKRMLELRAARRTSWPASRSTSTRRSSCSEILFDEAGAAGDAEDADRPAVDRRGRAEKLAERLPAAAADPRVPRPGEAASRTYTDKLPQMVNPRTGRVHTSYHQAVAVTGRLSSQRPEPAEHPDPHRRGPAHPRGLHRAAGPRDRRRRLFADRAAHHGAPLGRRGLLRAFADGSDIHRATAAEVFGVPLGRGQRATSAAPPR